MGEGEDEFVDHPAVADGPRQQSQGGVGGHLRDEGMWLT
jgi:hypothetical protein